MKCACKKDMEQKRMVFSDKTSTAIVREFGKEVSVGAFVCRNPNCQLSFIIQLREVLTLE